MATQWSHIQEEIKSIAIALSAKTFEVYRLNIKNSALDPGEGIKRPCLQESLANAIESHAENLAASQGGGR